MKGCEQMDNFIFGGCDTVELAKKYGTPLYVVNEDYILDRLNEIKQDFLEKFENTKAVYASKAFLTKEMARIIKKEGLGMDVVSGGELYTAIQVDFPMDKIIFHGNNKTPAEIEMAVTNEVGRIVVDSSDELELVNQIAKKHKKKVKILFRITPGVEAHTHKFIQTGQVDSKFGIPLMDNIITNVVKKAISMEFIDLLGFHFHIGSQIKSNEGYTSAVKRILVLINNLNIELDFETRELNVGGGFGIHYADDKGRKPLKFFTDAIISTLESECRKYNLKRPTVIIEPGRWIAGEAGITLYTIGTIKEIPGIRTYVSVDGGMTDNARPSLYDAKYEAVVANKYGQELVDQVTISGKLCESGDILIHDLKVPKIEIGDILAVLSTGAYNYSMASHYNRIPKPAVVMVTKGKDRLIVKRESYEDIIRNEL